MSEKILQQILGEVTNINKRIDGLENRFDKLETRFDNLENRFDKLETRFDNLENRFDKLETRFDKLETEVQVIKKQTEDIPAMKVAILETSEIVKRMEKVQEEHELTLHYLSRKYVDQEAKLKALSIFKAN